MKLNCFAFYQNWFGRPLLPAYDGQADGPAALSQHAAREAAWKRLLWAYRDRHREGEADRKRSERSATRRLAEGGDPLAKLRMETEAERGRRRRAEARVLAQEMRARVRAQRDLRAKQTHAAELLPNVQKVALEAPALPPEQYAEDLCKAFWAAEHPPGDWDSAADGRLWEHRMEEHVGFHEEDAGHPRHTAAHIDLL